MQRKASSVCSTRVVFQFGRDHTFLFLLAGQLFCFEDMDWVFAVALLTTSDTCVATVGQRGMPALCATRFAPLLGAVRTSFKCLQLLCLSKSPTNSYHSHQGHQHPDWVGLSERRGGMLWLRPVTSSLLS